MKITGACHCTAVQFEADVDPWTASICHCTDCQILTATAFRVSVHAVPGTLRFTVGTPKIWTRSRLPWLDQLAALPSTAKDR